jgi:hypothetical protein
MRYNRLSERAIYYFTLLQEILDEESERTGGTVLQIRTGRHGLFFDRLRADGRTDGVYGTWLFFFQRHILCGVRRIQLHTQYAVCFSGKGGAEQDAGADHLCIAQFDRSGAEPDVYVDRRRIFRIVLRDSEDFFHHVSDDI